MQPKCQWRFPQNIALILCGNYFVVVTVSMSLFCKCLLSGLYTYRWLLLVMTALCCYSITAWSIKCNCFCFRSANLNASFSKIQSVWAPSCFLQKITVFRDEAKCIMPRNNSFTMMKNGFWVKHQNVEGNATILM